MHRPIYDSRDRACKSPFGAVRTGEAVTFTLFLPKLHQSDEPVLKLYEMDRWEEPQGIPMRLVTSDYLTNTFSCTFIPREPCLYAYHFEVFGEGRLQSIKRGEDGAGVLNDRGHLWQLTVYDAAMRAPAFLREGVMYQIFPDRFCFSGQEKEGVPEDRILRKDWGAIPTWQPNEQGIMTNSDYFQGDLEGIRQKLDYLESLGVTAIYLNPIFESHSNHRYNTADYRKIDPLLGTEEDFRRLCADAGERGIRIILDGVFSHTGSDSVYFNKEKRYGEGGAFHDPDSPYRAWYQFKDYPWHYESWWGFSTLPNVNEQDPDYMEFICGEDGVLRKWLRAGASGYRLDVADELPDVFLDRLRRCVKDYNPDAAVIGEVWEDASNKESYGVRRRYLLGRQLDSVMNYPFKDAVLNYIRWGNYQLFYDIIMQILENYPKPAIQCLMNFLSTHDTVRAITELGGPPLENNSRQWQELHHNLSPDQYAHGCRLFALATILQFGLPGIPCIYYGDEAGLCGYKDPFNRVCYPWGRENGELLQLVRTLGKMRRDYPIFSEAEFVPYIFSRDVCVFARESGDTAIGFIVNRSPTPQRVKLPALYENVEVLASTGEFDGNNLAPFTGVVLAAKLRPGHKAQDTVTRGYRMKSPKRLMNRVRRR